MKLSAFLPAVIFLSACNGGGSLDDRFMNVAKYVAKNCRDSYVYDSLPTFYLRARDVSRDSLERLLHDWEGSVRRGKCPE